MEAMEMAIDASFGWLLTSVEERNPNASNIKTVTAGQ